MLGRLAPRRDRPAAGVQRQPAPARPRRFLRPAAPGLRRRRTCRCRWSSSSSPRPRRWKCSETVLAEIAALRADGATIAIDDFGTGYSNLARLRSMPLDRVKLDPSLIADIETSEKARVVVQAVIQLIKGVGCEIVAEAVENVAQADILRAMGCDTVQGFVFAAADVRGRILAWTRNADRGARSRRLAEHLLDDPRGRSATALDVLDRGAFVDLVHGRVGQAEIDHRAELDEEAAVRRAAAGRQLGLDAGLLADRRRRSGRKARPAGSGRPRRKSAPGPSRRAPRARRSPRPSAPGRRRAADC